MSYKGQGVFIMKMYDILCKSAIRTKIKASNKKQLLQDIANMAGTSRETVSRALSILEKELRIERNGRELIILDYKTFIKEFDS